MANVAVVNNVYIKNIWNDSYIFIILWQKYNTFASLYRRENLQVFKSEDSRRERFIRPAASSGKANKFSRDPRVRKVYGLL